VGEQVRESVANAVGRTVAEIVGDVVYDALVPRGDASSLSPRSGRHAVEPSSLPRRDYDESGWERQAEDALWRDRYRDDEVDDDAPHSYRKLDEPASDRREQRSRRWHEALVAGVQAAAWWLRRQRGPVSLLAALTVGAIASLTVLVGPAGNAANLVASALGLAYLLDLMRSASHLLAANLSSAWTRA
jgi:hypothetical protein